MFTGRRSDVATLLSSPQGHVGDVGLLAPDDSEHRAGNVAQVLLGQPHDQQVVMNSVSIEKKLETVKIILAGMTPLLMQMLDPNCV